MKRRDKSCVNIYGSNCHKLKNESSSRESWKLGPKKNSEQNKEVNLRKTLKIYKFWKLQVIEETKFVCDITSREVYSDGGNQR